MEKIKELKPNKYQQGKKRARIKAQEWQRVQALEGCDYLTLFKMCDKFEKLGKRYGLIKEFRENGII